MGVSNGNLGQTVQFIIQLNLYLIRIELRNILLKKLRNYKYQLIYIKVNNMNIIKKCYLFVQRCILYITLLYMYVICTFPSY